MAGVGRRPDRTNRQLHRTAELLRNSDEIKTHDRIDKHAHLCACLCFAFCRWNEKNGTLARSGGGGGEPARGATPTAPKRPIDSVPGAAVPEFALGLEKQMAGKVTHALCRKLSLRPLCASVAEERVTLG